MSEENENAPLRHPELPREHPMNIVDPELPDPKAQIARFRIQEAMRRPRSQ